MKGRQNNSTEHLQRCRQESFLFCSSSTGSAAALQRSLRGVISTPLLAFEDLVLSCCFVSGYTHYFVQPFVRELCRKDYAGWHRTLLTRIFLWTAGKAAAWRCFLFDIQQVTVSSTDGSVLQRVHRGKVSEDDATHGALLKLLLPHLGSVLVWPGCLTLAYKQTGAHTKHLNHFSLLYLWGRPRDCSNARANPHCSGRNSGERFCRISKNIFQITSETDLLHSERRVRRDWERDRKKKGLSAQTPVRILSGKLQSQDKGHAMPLIRRGEFHRWGRQNGGRYLNICQARAA